ncbi:MAG: metallophosphoesterase family protein [Pseudomonadota bacterium]
MKQRVQILLTALLARVSGYAALARERVDAVWDWLVDKWPSGKWNARKWIPQKVGGPGAPVQPTAEPLSLGADVELPVPQESLPNHPVYAIGDIHGRYDLLVKLVKTLRDDFADSGDNAELIFLGDYIDRGFQSKNVLDALIELERDTSVKTVFLRGNHEQVMLTFLQDASVGPDWGKFGGRETLISYGVIPPRSVIATEEWEKSRVELNASIPKDHVEFLEKLQTSYKVGPFGFVHAGVRSGVAFDEQSDRDRMWIRDEFLTADDREDLFIVHAHTPTKMPYADHRRINIDTGAYYSGRLTAVRLDQKMARFLSI